MDLSRPSFVPRHSRTAHSESLNDEICIYEWTTQRVHALNATAARVWTLCDGTRTVAQIAETLRGEIGIHADEVVGLALAQFSDAGLLEAQVPAGAVTLSRRGVVKRLGLTVAMLPVVSSIAAPSALEAASGNTQVFNFTGASQTFVVPAGVMQITIDALGAWGSFVASGPAGNGLGGKVIATIPVTPGETLIVNVGGGGSVFLGGFNGGGNGGAPFSFGAYGGGGASDVRRGSSRLLVAGGGGGFAAANSVGFGLGGAGGGTTGGAGGGGTSGGGGGTPSAGGTGGAAGSGGTAGTAGALGIGGNGGLGGAVSPHTANSGGGGGGGGYFGGGGGGGAVSNIPDPLNSGGGGGGSSYTDPAAINVTHVQGVHEGDGKVTITW